MTGSALFDFLISLVALMGAVGLFMYAIEGLSPNALFTKIARVAVGVAALIALLLAIKGVFFGRGGLVIPPLGIIYFAIGIIVVLVVMYLVRMAVEAWLPEYAEPILFVVGALALIALLGLAATALFGGPVLGSAPRPLSMAVPR